MKLLMTLWKHYKLLKEDNIRKDKLIVKLQKDNEHMNRMLIDYVCKNKELHRKIESNSIRLKDKNSTKTSNITNNINVWYI